MPATQSLSGAPLLGGRLRPSVLSTAIAGLLGVGLLWSTMDVMAAAGADGPVGSAGSARSIGSTESAEVTGAVDRLAPVVVTAAGFEQEVDEAPASITIITREELERRQVTNLAEALRGVEGVNVSPLDARDGKTGNQSISLRGLPRDYTLVMIDGVRQNPMGNITPNSFNDSQSVFIPPIAAIERIEVIRGPMSTLYGSDALGGVVNIITRRPDREAWGGSASVSRTFQQDSDFGDHSLVEAYLSGPMVEDKLAMKLQARYLDRESSDIQIPGVVYPRPVTADTPTMGQNPVGANLYTVGGELLFTPSQSHDISLVFNSTRQEYDNRNGDIGALHRTGNPRPSACNAIPAPNYCRGYERELHFERDQWTLGHVGRFGIGTLETRLTRDELETRGRTIPLGSGLDPSLEGSARSLKLKTDLLDTRFLTGVGNHLISLGAQYIDASMTDGIWGGGTNSLRQYSLFAEDEWRILDSFALTAGLRYDDNEYYSGKWVPRLYGVWNVDERWILKGGVASGFRTPYLEQLTDGIIGYGNQGSVPLFGNPGLKPETGVNYELSLLYRMGQSFDAQATIFQNDLEDLVERGTGANAGKDLNIGEARIRGLELGVGWSLTDAVRLSGNYAYTDSEVTRTQLDTGNPAQLIASKRGDPLVSVPEHMLNALLTWQATPKLETFLRAEYRSSAFRPRNFHEPQNGGNAQGQVARGWRDSNIVIGDFKGYSLFDLGATYQISRMVRVTGVIQNLLGKDFIDYRPYTRCTNAGCTGAGEEAFSNVYNSILEPRRLFVSLNLDF